MKEEKTSQFTKFAVKFGDLVGSPFSFTFWVFMLVVWVILGHFMHWSDSWQLLANTPTTWLELFVAICTLYVGNRIERRQERHEKHMLDILERIEQNKSTEQNTNGVDTLPGIVIK